MILIKLSAHRNTIVVAVVILIVAFAVAVSAASGGAKNTDKDIFDKKDPATTEAYSSETQDEITDTSDPAINNEIPAADTTEEETTAEEKSPIQYYTEQDVIDIAKVLYRECRGIKSETEKACVVWTILNRVDKYGTTVYFTVRESGQYAFSENTPVWNDLKELARDVLKRWNYEKNGEELVGRVLPKEYLYFEGDGVHNYFKDNYVYPCNVWDYSIESPYED